MAQSIIILFIQVLHVWDVLLGSDLFVLLHIVLGKSFCLRNLMLYFTRKKCNKSEVNAA